MGGELHRLYRFKKGDRCAVWADENMVSAINFIHRYEGLPENTIEDKLLENIGFAINATMGLMNKGLFQVDFEKLHWNTGNTQGDITSYGIGYIVENPYPFIALDEHLMGLDFELDQLVYLMLFNHFDTFISYLRGEDRGVAYRSFGNAMADFTNSGEWDLLDLMVKADSGDGFDLRFEPCYGNNDAANYVVTTPRKTKGKIVELFR